MIVLAGTALANGRPPGTSTIAFRKGAESHIVAGLTFGMLESHDSGVTWHWACEDAVGYAGVYDPDYVYTATGALFATTYRGLKVNRGGCDYDATSLGTLFVSTVTQGPDDAIYAAITDTTNANVIKSVDNGTTFPIAATPGQIGDQYLSLEVAPSNANRLYLSGYRYDAGGLKVHSLFTSGDGGQSWTALPVGDFQTMSFSTIDIVGISKTDPRVVFARVNVEDNLNTDAVYRSADGGQSWTKILSKTGPVAFLVRANGDLLAASAMSGAERSTNNGTSWLPLAAAPHISCLAENSAGEVWACTQNYGMAEADGYGIMKSSDLASWIPVLKYQDIKGPIACPAGTIQKDNCDTMQWCALCAQLGCDAKRPCPDVASDAGPIKPPKDGCCQTGTTSTPGLMLLVVVIGILLPRRRR
jgi:photosystem II stability/assembly factor-like uncharacterized protein